MASLVLLILSAAVVLFIHPATAGNNVLLENQILYPDQQLSYEGSSLVMQSDCKLVLYKNGGKGRLINTYGPAGVNCTLSFNYNGRLIIRHPNGTTVWITPNFYSRNGTYAAVLRPDGEVAIYGPAVWSTAAVIPTVEQPQGLGNVPVEKNLLFSGQVLDTTDKLTSRDFSFVMKEDCNLVLNKAGSGLVWQTRTSGNGYRCILRLDHQGRMVVLNFWRRVVWDNKVKSKEGEYVLVLQDNGQAVVYGPVAWSTATTTTTAVHDGSNTGVAVE